MSKKWAQILAKVNTRRIAKEQTTQLPPLDVNVQQLCHLVWNTWQNQYDYIGKTVTSYEKHSHFIEAARRCCQPALDQQRQRNQVQSRIYSQTLSSKAKRQQKNQLFHSQLDAEPAHKLEPTRAKAAKPVVVSEEEQLRIAIQKSRRSSMVKLSTDQERNVDKIVDLLSIPPIHRSPSSIKKSFMLVRSIPAFSKLSNFVLTQLCAVMALNLTPSGQIVFRQGEEGTCWYVILQGTVEIWIALPGLLVYTPGSEIYLEPDQIKQRSKMVAILGQGYGFGELAIMNDSLRAATIITSSDCILLKVEKRNYNQIVRSIYEQESRNKISFLKKIPIIGNAIDIKNLADVSFPTEVKLNYLETHLKMIPENDRQNIRG